MLTVHTGANHLLLDVLMHDVGQALAGGDETLYIVVPRQLTLFAERVLIAGLHLGGSFRLRVTSPARLCAHLFEETGMPQGVRVDDRGRVMLVRQAVARAGERLKVYRGAHKRRGFAEKCARELEVLTQGGISPQTLRECAQRERGLTAMKLCDLAEILEDYTKLIAGRYTDGDSELIEGAARAAGAELVRGARFFFFGFDLMPPTLMQLIAQLSAACVAAELYFPLENDVSARDYDCYRPLEKALSRLLAACREAGAQTQRQEVNGAASEPGGELRALGRELFAYPPQPYAEACLHIHARTTGDMRSECMAVAAQARMLAISGMRWGDIQLMVNDLESYRPLLQEAFAIYEVPLFLECSRPVSRMATAECLLTAMRILQKNYRSEDVCALMRTGYCDLSADECDRLANYAVRRGIDNGRWRRRFTRGNEAEVAEMEPLRARLVTPLEHLREYLRAAEDLPGQLKALFDYLEEISAGSKSAALAEVLKQGGMAMEANELSQAWNRIIGAFDQMAALMGTDKLALEELTQTLSESLDAAVVKPLPQSGDAVFAQGLTRLLQQPARAVFVLGAADRAAPGSDALLTSGQRRLLSEQTRAYLGPDETDEARIRRFYLKEALGMARQEVYFSCPLSGADGSAQRPGLAFTLLREIFPALREEGGATPDGELLRTLACAPRAAEAAAARVIAARQEGKAPAVGDVRAEAALKAIADRLPDVRQRLDALNRQLSGRPARESVSPRMARALYGELQKQSISRLERFAACPFSYFAQYGLRPDRVEPYTFDRRDTGTFLHEAARDFLNASKADLNALTPAAARQRMEGIVAEKLATLGENSPLADSAVARAQESSLRDTALRCAEVLARQMQGSAFHTEIVEGNFGPEDGPERLVASDCTLEGRIDRVDSWPQGQRLRVIDYKLGGKGLNLAGVYYGLNLQLPVYLGAAMKRERARSAGAYYFKLDEGIVNTQSTDPREVEKERSDSFRMSGLLPSDPELIRAQAPQAEDVFSVRFTGEGKPHAAVPCADDADFNHLVRHALRKAGEQIAAIRAGEARVSPARMGQTDACRYCDYRAACLMDEARDARTVRRLENLRWDEALKRMALEDGAPGQDAQK